MTQPVLQDLLSQANKHHGAGQLGEAETLYRAILADEPNNGQALHGLGVLALQTGNADAATDLIGQAIDIMPETAEAMSNLGLALKRQGKFEDAIKAFRAAIDIDPGMVEAHSNLGGALREMGRTRDAVDALRDAAGAGGEVAEINLNLGAALIEAGDNEQALPLLARAVAERPAMAATHYNMGKALFNLGKFDAAASAYQAAVERDPDFADARHNLAHALLAGGRLAEGWAEYGWRWRSSSKSSRPREFPLPIYQGGPLNGRNLLIWGEQGIGDEILFAGLIPELAVQADACLVECDARLVNLFRRSLPGLGVVARADPPDPQTSSADLDLQVAMGDLPRWTRPSLEGFQPLGRYLRPDPDRVRECRLRYAALGDGLKVGLSWASRPPKGIALAELGPLLTQPGLNFVNLQYGDHRAEIAATEKLFDIRIFDDPAIDPLADLDGFASQIDALDAVLTIQNTTLFVAGALGKPVFGLIKSVPDWRWFGGDENRWHDDVSLFRQDAPGEWARAVDELSGAFRRRFFERV